MVGLLEDALVGARFLAAVPGVLRQPLSVEGARAEVRRRLTSRTDAFLQMSRRIIFSRPGHPIRRLLALAGCERGDLGELVARQGLDDALLTLCARGVYLTLDEFKGRRPVVRGSTSFQVDPVDLVNPLPSYHLPSESGGSRAGRTQVRNDIRRLRDFALGRRIYIHAVGGEAWEHGIWEVPGALPIVNLLQLSAAAAAPNRLFLQVNPGAPGLPPRYRWSGWALQLGGLLASRPVPRPQHVPLSDPLPIAHWMAEALRVGRTPQLYTFVSAAVRVAEAALEAGIDLRGARFMLSSEPATAARQARIREAGAEAVPTYGSTETANIGEACAARTRPDSMHLLDDIWAVVQPGRLAEGRSGLAPKSLLFSTLRPLASFGLINLSLGDQAELAAADCGCPLQQAGWVRQLYDVRSHEKLTAGGMSLLDIDVIRVLEEVLPARFGGGPLDFQLVEAFTADGQGTLRLLAHPRLGELDGRALAEAFLQAIDSGSGADRVRELQWRSGEMLRVERSAPRLTPAGKVLHLHQEQAGGE